MNRNGFSINRRHFVAALSAASLLPPSLLANTKTAIRKTIPISGETLAVIGLGTSRTFDVDSTSAVNGQLQTVMAEFFNRGGSLIDSSPMYGKAEQVTGDLLKRLPDKPPAFAATKVWTDGRDEGVTQMNRSFNRMGVSTMDLMQIHNLRDWRVHLPTLREWKEQGRIRYIGITTSHGRNHDALEQVLKEEAFDFVQLSYNLADRAVENRLLPLAADKGIAVLANRAFQRGGLFKQVKGKQLPAWAADIDCESWGQFFLKFVVSHPAVTCAIPATSKLSHMIDNMAAGFGELPNMKTREKMLAVLS